jgi:ubiquinone/menaquinone biosynthesis C-methylase UbiE
VKLLKECPVCNSLNFAEKITCNDHTTSKENFKIVSCETCLFTFTNPRPVDEKLDEYYKSDMYISHTNNAKGLFNWMYQKIRVYSIGKKVKLLKKLTAGGAHLDIGCGTGEFLNACKKAGFETKGLEPSEIARKQAIKNYNLVVSKNSDLKQYYKSEFNSISMWHVLEHLPNLKETICNLHKILSPDGKLIIAVPNNKSYDAKYYKEYWAGWDVPIHLWHFSKKTIEQLFEKNKFKLIKKKPMIFDSFYVSLLSEEFKSGKKNFFKGFMIGLISNLYGIFTKSGHSSIIYIFEKKK